MVIKMYNLQLAMYAKEKSFLKGPYVSAYFLVFGTWVNMEY